MKKLSILIVVLLMVSMVAMPVLAAQDASMTLSASKTNLEPGDTFTVTVSTTKVESCTTGGFLFQFDENVFEYVDGSALVSGFAMAGISTANGRVAGYFMVTIGSTTINGEIFRITLKVKDSASNGSYTITGIPSLTVLSGSEKESVSAIAGSVTVKVGTTQTEPTESETVAATTEPVETPTTEATETKDTEATTEATTQATTEATAEITEPSKDTEATTQPTEIITIGAVTPAEEKAGFPWWIPFALLGIGSIIAIIVIKKKS